MNKKSNLQPILKQQQKDDYQTTQSNTSTKAASSTQMTALKKQGSYSITKRAGSSKQQVMSPPSLSSSKTMKESTFNYKEQLVNSNTGEGGGIPNRQLFKKSQSTEKTKQQNTQGKSNSSGNKQTNIEVVHQSSSNRSKEQDLAECGSGRQQQDQQQFPPLDESRSPAGERPFDMPRASDEVQYQEEHIGEGGTGEKEPVTQSFASSSQGFQIYESNSKFSPTIVNTEEYFQHQNNRRSSYGKYSQMKESGFKVHNEESFKGANEEEDRLLQIEAIGKVVDQQYNNSEAHNPSIQNRNSDFNKFNVDEDREQQQSLRMAKKIEEESKERNKFIDKYERQLAHLDHIDNQEVFQQNKLDEENFQNNNNQDMFGGTSAFSPTSFGSPQLQLQVDDRMMMEHLLPGKNRLPSFALDQNMHMEYPPMQINEQRQSQQQQFFQPLSPRTALHQQKLQEILSRGGQTPDKMDETQLNNLIDMEKNYVIMQYESILQQLNVEFHKLLTKSRETEDAVIEKDRLAKAQSLMMQEKDELLYQQEQVMKQLRNQVQDLMNDIEFNNSKNNIHRSGGDIETFRIERELQDQKLHSQQSHIRSLQHVEQDLRDQLDSICARLRTSDQQLRMKDEDLSQLERDRLKLGKDLKIMGEIEQQLKEEVKTLCFQRQKLEDQLQEEASLKFQLEIGKRQREMEMENLIRDNRSLKGSLEILQHNFQEVSQENIQLKDQITEYERQKIQSKSITDKQQSEVKRIFQEASKTQILLEQANKQIQWYQNNQNSQVEQQFQVPSKLQQNTHTNNYRNHEDLIAANENQVASVSYYPEPKHTIKDQYQSPQRNQRNQPQQMHFNNQSPASNIGATQMKNNIVWLSQASSQQSNQNSQQAQQRRNTNAGQNESQLQDIFRWPSSSTGQHVSSNSPLSHSRSLEKLTKNSFNASQPPYNNNQESVWNKGKSALAQYVQPSPPSKQYAKSQQEDQDLPAAGKKSTIQVNQSPLHNRTNKNYDQQVLHMQNSLSALQQDKDMLEKEFRRIGTHPKNKQQIEKKQQVEVELDILNQNIGNIKQKLRELNAL